MILYEIALWVVPIVIALTTLIIGGRALVFCLDVLRGTNLDKPPAPAATEAGPDS